jgi:hypothetical protein
MKHIKTPLFVPQGVFGGQIFDRDCQAFCEVETERQADELAQAVNSFDALLAACKEAYELMDDRTNTFPEPCDDVTMLSTMITLKTAIEKAEGAQ